jgi:MYXO-CTERM domain-containing protein
MRLLTRHHLLPAALALTALLGSAPVTALTYTESTQGDLPSEGLLKTLNLDAGTNHVYGSASVRGVTNVGAVADLDSFAFVVAEGQQLVQISAQLWDATGNMNWVGWRLYQSATAQHDDGISLSVTLQSFSPGTDTVDGAWGAGLYQLRNTNLSWFGTEQEPLAVADYRIDLVVRDAIPAVPEPGTWLMAAAGLALLAARRPRRSAPGQTA